LVDPGGRAVLLCLARVTWKTGGTTETSTKLKKKKKTFEKICKMFVVFKKLIWRENN